MVQLPSGRQLIQDGTEMTAQRLHTAEQPPERFLGVLQFLHVSEKAAGFYSIEKTARRTGGPASERRFLRKSVEGVVDLDRIERPCVVFEPPAFRHRCRIKIAAPV